MKSKKNLLIVIAVVVVIIALIFIVKGRNSSVVAPSNENVSTETEQPAIFPPAGKMTDAIFVELMARSRVGLENGDNEWMPTEEGDKFMNFLQQQGISFKELEEYADALASDPVRSQEVDIKLSNRLTELRGK